MKRLYILMNLLMLTGGLGAKIYVPEGKSEFFEGLSRHPYAVVHYINYEQVGDDKLKQQALESMKTAFNQSSNESAYVLSRISFIGTNSRTVPDLIVDIEKQHNVPRTDTSTDFSIVFLLKNGKPVQDDSGGLAMLKNAFDQADLGTFIEKYLGDYIAYQLQQSQARAQQYAVQEPRTATRYVEQPVSRYVEQPVSRYVEQPVYRRSYSPVYVEPYVYGGYGYPYGYGYGPGVGIGFGFGGRRGGVGFGFGI